MLLTCTHVYFYIHHIPYTSHSYGVYRSIHEYKLKAFMGISECISIHVDTYKCCEMLGFGGDNDLYGVATMSRLLKSIGLFCKRAP